MFGPRSHQSVKSMMFGSNKLERGIIFVTVHTLFDRKKSHLFMTFKTLFEMINEEKCAFETVAPVITITLIC